MLLTATMLTAQTNQNFSKVQELGGIEEYKLDKNGLSVLLMEDHSAPVVTVMVTYNVGSRNEVTGTTGATHLLEHLMFKGTDKYNRADGTGMDAMLQNRGALLNATTWLDRTNYFENLPSEHLELALDIEADRMRNLWLRDEDRKPEMTVVRNEFERGENSAFGSLNKAIWQTAIVAHPYHHSTIGWRSDIEGVPIEKLREFYDTFYWPNNATVTVIGDFDKNKALDLIDQYFGTIPSSPNPIPDVYTEEPDQLGQRRTIVKRAGQLGALGVAHKIPEGSHPDMFALDVLSQILTNGKTSRLYKALVDQGKTTTVFASQNYFKDPSLFVTYAFLAPGAEHEEVEETIVAQYDSIKANGVSQAEVDRAINQIAASTAFGRDGSFSIASNINEWIAMGDWTYYVTYTDNIKKVTPADVQRVVETYFVEDKSTVGYFIPKTPGSQGSKQGAASWQDLELNEGPYFYRPENHGDEGSNEIASGLLNAQDTDISKNIRDKKVRGIRVVTMPTGVENVVSFRGSFAAGDAYNPESNTMIASLVADLLDEGTSKRSKFEIAEILENTGAQLSFSAGSQTLTFSGRSLKSDVPLIIELLAEQLRYPAFDEAEFEKAKTRWIGNLKRTLENTNAMAGGELARTVYPVGHPNYSPTVERQMEDVEKMTLDDLKAFHDRLYGPESMVFVATGDVDPKAIEKAIRDEFKGWKGGINYSNFKAASPQNGDIKDVMMEDKTSVTVALGTALGIDSDHKDYLPLYLGTYILGGNFSARLMSTVRDQEGLTYGINSFVSGATMADGHWQLNATFAPNLLDQGIESTMKQVNMWIEDGVSAEELDAKKSTVSGSYKVQMATSGGMAGRILSVIQQGKPLSYMDDYVKEVNAVSLDQVNAAIKKYVKPEQIITVRAGTIPSEE